MDVRIGIAESNQVIEVELPDEADRTEIRARVHAVLDGTEPVLVLEDRKGKELSVPGTRVAFVEIGAESTARKSGFGA